MKLEVLIGKSHTLQGSDRYLRSVEHDSLVVDTVKQIFYWNSRSIVGDAFTWLTRVEGLSDSDARTYVPLVDEDIFQQPIKRDSKNVIVYPALVDIFYQKGLDHLDYWTDIRGYTRKTIDDFQLGYSGYWYTIPIFVDSKFVNFQCRQHGDGVKRIKMWYSYGEQSSTPFGFSILKYTDTVYITEGPVDAIMLLQHGIPAISQTAGAGNIKLYIDNFALLNSLKNIYICYDNDKAGNSAATELSLFIGYKAMVYNMWDFDSAYDVTDYFRNGGTSKEFKQLVKEKAKYGFELEAENGSFNRHSVHRKFR